MTNKKDFLSILAIGLATFAMYFGAGNIAFPINIGRSSGFYNNYAILGMLTTSLLVPFLGLVSLLLIKGNYKFFFGLLGKVPGTLMTFLIMALIGPFGATPRCLALSYTTFSLYVTDISSLEFGILGSVIIFIFSYKKNYIMSIMGKVLTPILLASLMVILIVGINHTYRLDYGDSQYSTSISAFYTGLREGLNTMDLFASFFFSIIIFPALELHIKKFQNYELTSAIIFRNSLKISSIAMSLLGIIYYGMSFISSHNLVSLKEVDLSKQLANMATLFLGQQASLIANLVVSLACLTTAITLVVIFSEFIVTNTRMFFMPYVLVLTTTIIVSLIMGQLGFGGIVKMLKPVLLLLYPMLIALSIGNILRVFYGFKYSSIFAYLTFATSLTINFL